jgi:poly(3-hydroxybutyrate) depolymerase
VHYVVRGGGHGWPGSRPSRLGDAIVGATNQDFSATRAIEGFLERVVAD